MPSQPVTLRSMLLLSPHLHLALSSGLKFQVSLPEYSENDKSQWEDNTYARDRPTNKWMNDFDLRQFRCVM